MIDFDTELQRLNQERQEDRRAADKLAQTPRNGPGTKAIINIEKAPVGTHPQPEPVDPVLADQWWAAEKKAQAKEAELRKFEREGRRDLG